MPTINIFFNNDQLLPQLQGMTSLLKSYTAEQLTCGDRRLDQSEVSARLIKIFGEGMLAAIELEITAAPYEERVKKQDDICLNIREFVLTKVTSVTDVQVWLILCELGHSIED